jgi:hypothetical protein
VLLGLVSAKGAPGVTSAAVALTAVSGGVMVELDPSGGSVDCWLRATGEPGLIRAASALRRQADPTALLQCAAEVVPGVRVLRSPTSGLLAESTVVALRDRLLPALAELNELLIVDCGRWSRSQPTSRRLVGCDVVALVCSPTIEGVEAARWQVEQLGTLIDRVALVPVGDRPYGPDELTAATGAEVAGVLAWDRRGLARLLERGTAGGWQRTQLARSARDVLHALGFARQPLPTNAPAPDVEDVEAAVVNAVEPGAAHA